MSEHLDESTRLTVRNTLLADPDLGLDAAMSTAISHLLSPRLAAYVAAERDRAVREALAPVRALAGAQQSEGDRLIEANLHRNSPASEKRTVEGYAMRRAAAALRAALPDDREDHA